MIHLATGMTQQSCPCTTVYSVGNEYKVGAWTEGLILLSVFCFILCPPSVSYALTVSHVDSLSNCIMLTAVAVVCKITIL